MSGGSFGTTPSRSKNFVLRKLIASDTPRQLSNARYLRSAKRGRTKMVVAPRWTPNNGEAVFASSGGISAVMAGNHDSIFGSTKAGQAGDIAATVTGAGDALGAGKGSCLALAEE